ncbi:F-box/WD repeat-containing protein 5 [Armadillidium nasatum]|uniref:F-box/WD repeat-containing protein 5 n=1 Tax=Armadillidium nasatum TaxID=96803 RepID=A0A5N5TFZ7_9CRUS|nr:F-box/WD repeat-containing protein 5 [Armadillidium nasatum]
MMNSNVNWVTLPDSILLKIFSYLNVAHISVISLVCSSWYRVAQDEFLWKRFFLEDFQISKKKKLAPGKTSWIAEYRRLIEEIPLVECECLEEHYHQVLHVSFSHNGEMFATTSKDGFVVVWASSYPAEMLFYKDMKLYSWKYTQFSQFNSTDDLLLVSGVHFGSSSTSGEIAVFNLEDNFKLQCRVLNKPYDIFGTWFNDEYLLSGELKWLGQMVSANIIWLNKANQGLESEHEAILSRMYQFYNINASSIRTLLAHGNPPSLPIFQSSDKNCPSTFGVSSKDEEETSIDPCVKCYQTSPEKLLIFTTGSKTYSPHQIGIKRVKNFKIPTIIDVGPCLKERIEQRDMERELRNQGLLQRPDWLNYESVKDKFDIIDHVFDLHGHIIGMNLSPDHRFLYVNSRPWPQNYTIENPLHPPIIAQEIDIHVIDLVDMKEVGSLLRSHRAYTPNAECFFIFLDVSQDYVASGAEDKHGYLWERNYETCVARLRHTDVVNSVAFNPVDPETLVSVSDDHRIKIWRSRRRTRELGIKIEKEKLGQELRLKRSRVEDEVMNWKSSGRK